MKLNFRPENAIMIMKVGLEGTSSQSPPPSEPKGMATRKECSLSTLLDFSEAYLEFHSLLRSWLITAAQSHLWVFVFFNMNVWARHLTCQIRILGSGD